MWDVVRFAEQMLYDAIVVENVVEATLWVGWRAWHLAMADLGYEHKVLSQNSMHHGVPQSRDRIYVVFWRKGLAVDLEMEHAAYCGRCDRDRTVRQGWKNGRTVGRYRQQWTWNCTACGAVCEPATRPAADIIDWTLPCPRIGDRARPLAPGARARILAGLRRNGWAPDPAAPGASEAEGFLLQTAHGGRIHDLDQPHPTVCASDDRLAFVVPLRRHGQATATSGPRATVTASGNHHALIMRNNRGGAEMVTPATEPVRTITTAGHQSLLVPYNGTGRARTTAEPLGTQPTRDRWALVDTDQAVDDCGFRMFEPPEVADAMSLPHGYIPDSYTKKVQVKLAGNAVTPPVMEWNTGRILQALTEAA